MAQLTIELLDFEAISFDERVKLCKFGIFTDEADSQAMGSVASCSADSVQIGLGVSWNVHTHDQVHVFGVNATRSLFDEREIPGSSFLDRSRLVKESSDLPSQWKRVCDT